MTYKDLLVHVDDSEANAGRVEAAVHLAAAYDAHLTGLYVLPSHTGIPVFTEAHIPGEILEAQRNANLARAEEARTAFTAAVENAGVSSEWRFVEGDVTATLSLHGRYADLLVLGQANYSDPLSIGRWAMEQVLLDVGRPVLMIPYIGAPKVIGKRVIVAWNRSREAMRALHDALPLLQGADAVQVWSVNPPRRRAGDDGSPGADISLHLARHGVKAEAAFSEANDIEVGELLLSRVADRQADLIVMGAYGRSRYRELILGGATREILGSMTVPVLMSH